MPILSVFFHNFYGNDQEWLRFFSNELTMPFHLFYNCVSDSYYRVVQNNNLYALAEQEPVVGLQQLHVKESTNKGKDIGGKLVLMDAFLKTATQSDYILLLHDKQSPYQTLSEQWKKDLFRIAEKKYQQTIAGLFNDPQTGMVASQKAIRNEADNEQKRNAYVDSSLIKSLKDEYDIHPPGSQFVAGTMFWVRASLFTAFFTQHAPLQIRSTLEPGNITDIEGPTITHAWERMLSWIVTSQGYQIKGM